MPDLLPPDHPDRRLLAAEVHARPPEPLGTPCRASYAAVRIAPEARAAERAQLAALCALHGAPAPAADQIQWSATLGPLRVKWERHGEFSSYTFFAPGLGGSADLFAEAPATRLPAGWLAGLPGHTVFAAHAVLVGAAELDAGSVGSAPPRRAWPRCSAPAAWSAPPSATAAAWR